MKTKIKIKKHLRVPGVSLNGEGALMLERKTVSAETNAAWAARCLRNLLPEILRSELDRALVRRLSEILIVVETAGEDARAAIDFLRKEIDPHRAAIKSVVDAEGNANRFTVMLKPDVCPTKTRGKRGPQ